MKQNIYNEVAAAGVITERQILTFKSRLNRGESEVLNIFDNGYLNITPEQTNKGLRWLLDQWKTPNGKERKNNPFGERETTILGNFSHFQLIDFIDCGNAYFFAFLPVYRVVSLSGAFFDYFVSMGVCNING